MVPSERGRCDQRCHPPAHPRTPVLSITRSAHHVFLHTERLHSSRYSSRGQVPEIKVPFTLLPSFSLTAPLEGGRLQKMRPFSQEPRAGDQRAKVHTQPQSRRAFLTPGPTRIRNFLSSHTCWERKCSLWRKWYDLLKSPCLSTTKHTFKNEKNKKVHACYTRCALHGSQPSWLVTCTEFSPFTRSKMREVRDLVYFIEAISS